MTLFRFYLLCINLVTFIIRGVDKRIARYNGMLLEDATEKGEKEVETKSRVSEKTLLIVCLLGGRAGGYLAMTFFRHKTLKGDFLWRFWSIVIIWICILFYYMTQFR